MARRQHKCPSCGRIHGSKRKNARNMYCEVCCPPFKSLFQQDTKEEETRRKINESIDMEQEILECRKKIEESIKVIEDFEREMGLRG